MTAEIAVMNKSGIALAADSAVTIQAVKGKKIYNSVNKLFSLSKYRPVGVMIYGGASLMGVPWETIIKLYRSELAETEFGKLEQYISHFVKYLENNRDLFPRTLQDDYFNEAIEAFFAYLRMQIEEEINTHIACNSSIGDAEISEIASRIIRVNYDHFRNMDDIPTLNDAARIRERLLQRYRQSIQDKKKAAFQNLAISSATSRQLTQLCLNIFLKNVTVPGSSGVVIAGFGKNDLFPVIISLTVNAVIDNKLIYFQVKSNKIAHDNNAAIMAFAQGEMVETFMEGLDPDLGALVLGYLTELFVKDYPESIVASIPRMSKRLKDDLRKKLEDFGQHIIADFSKMKDEYQSQHLVSPVVNATSFLPKDELAAMAESLVHLTLFKRRVSMDPETVGGPIDVAVISKGDGFVWIKRKHYFEQELNHQFFCNYFR